MPSAGLARSAVLAVAAITLTGCAQVVAGNAGADPEVLERISERNKPLSGRQALGELSTIDYCSLLEGVKSSAAGEFSPPADASFEYCGYFFDRGEQLTYVTVGYLGNRRTTGTDKGVPVDDMGLPHGLSVTRLRRSEACAYGLVFVDNLRLEISAAGDGMSSEQRCELARSALDGAVEVIADDAVRHYEYPATSFGTFRPCAPSDPLLTTERVAGEIGTDLRLWRWPNGHACTWTAGRRGGGTAAFLYFLTYFPDVLASIEVQETIRGRKTYVEEVGSSCRVLTPHISNAYMYEEQVGEPMVETAVIEVADSVTDKPCDVARVLARSAWPELPTSE